MRYCAGFAVGAGVERGRGVAREESRGGGGWGGGGAEAYTPSKQMYTFRGLKLKHTLQHFHLVRKGL